MKKNNQQGYSVIISLLLIGFLLVLTTTVFNLVLRELRDTRGLGNSIKAFAGAESAQELALLKIKEKGYGVDVKVDMNTATGKILATDINNINKNKDVLISYDLDIATNNYTETLSNQGYSIIPLFVEEDSGSTSYISNYNLSINSGTDSLLVWNLISGNEGISGLGNETDFGDGKKIESNGESSFIGNKRISDFLSDNYGNESYLILFNSGNQDIEFTLIATNPYENFSKPKTQIISSAQVGDYRHNLQTDYDNTEFLNMLKYSVFSN